MLKESTFSFPSIFQMSSWTTTNSSNNKMINHDNDDDTEQQNDDNDEQKPTIEEIEDQCYFENEICNKQSKQSKVNLDVEIFTVVSPISSSHSSTPVSPLSPKNNNRKNSNSINSIQDDDNQCVPMSVDSTTTTFLDEMSIEISSSSPTQLNNNNNTGTFSPSQLFKNNSYYANFNNNNINCTNSNGGISFMTNPFQFFKSIRSTNIKKESIVVDTIKIKSTTTTNTTTTNTNDNEVKIKIEELPLELIVHIFGFLEYNDIGLRTSMLNKNFREISEFYFIWKNLYTLKTELNKIKKKRNKFFDAPIDSIFKTSIETITVPLPLPATTTTTKTTIDINSEPLKDYKFLYKKRTITERNWKRGICSVQTLYGHQEGVWGVQFHGDTLVSCCEGGVMKVWDINEGECLNTLYGHSDVVNSYHFEKDRIVSGSDDSTLKMWNSTTGQCINTFTGHQGSVWMLEFKDNWLVSGGDDRMVRVWDTNTGQQVSTLRGHNGKIYYVQLGNNLVVSGAQDRNCKIWDLRIGKTIHSMNSNSAVHCLQIDGNLWDNDWAIASGHHNGSIGVWNMRTGSLQGELSNPIFLNPVWHIQFRNNIIYTSSCNDLYSWNLNIGSSDNLPTSTSTIASNTPTTKLSSNKVFKGHTKAIKHFQVKDSRLVSGGLDNKIKVWDLDKPGNNYLYTLVGHTKSVDWLEFKNDKLVSCSADHTIRIWDFYSS